MIIRIPQFTGLVPRIPPQMIPDTGAQVAIDCEFANKELRQIKGDAALPSLPAGTQSFYSVNGITFLSWKHRAYPSPSPIPDDKYDRVYFVDTSGSVVVTREDFAEVGGTNGLPISKQHYAGVPQPDQAAATVTTRSDNLPKGIDSFRVKAFWEYGGTRYQETDVSSPTTNNKNFIVHMPEKEYKLEYSTDGVKEGEAAEFVGYKWATPAASVPVALIEGLDEDGEVVFKVYANSPTKSNSTGGVSGGATVETEVTNKKKTDETVKLPGSDAPADASTIIGCDLNITLNYGEISAYAYVWTAVNLYGEEGPPSDPVIVRPAANNNVSVARPTITATGYREIQKFRLYRTATGSSGTAFFYVDEINTSTGSFDDELNDDLLGEELPSEGWYPPPQGSGKSILKLMPNGILALVMQDTIYFSHAYLPHAWNPLDAISLGHQVVAAEIGDAGLICITTEGAYLISGMSPDAMTQYRLPVEQTCLNEKAITQVGNGVAYASNDGIVFVRGTQATIAPGQQFYTRNEWSKFISGRYQRLQLATHDGYLYVFFDGDPSKSYNHGLRLNLDDDGSLSEFTGVYECSGVIPQTDGLYFFRSGNLYRYGVSDVWDSKNGDPDVTFTWESKDFIVPRPATMGVLEIDCESVAGIQVKVYADDDLKFTGSAAGYEKLTLPSGFLSRKWRIKLSGAGVVRSVTMAGSRMELGSV